MQRELKALRLQLAQFGLNPSEWALRIDRRINNQIKLTVYSVCDAQPVFAGIARSGQWCELALQG